MDNFLSGYECKSLLILSKLKLVVGERKIILRYSWYSFKDKLKRLQVTNLKDENPVADGKMVRIVVKMLVRLVIRMVVVAVMMLVVRALFSV